MKTAKCQRWLIAMFAFLLLVTGGPGSLATIVHAEESIQLSVIAGIGGEYKETGIVPVQVTVTNGGADIEGELLVATGDRGNNEFSVGYYQPVSIAKGAAKQVTITVPGSELNSNTYVALMKNDKIVAQTPVGGKRYSYDTLMVGVLAQSQDTANFLGVLPKNVVSYDVRVLPMKPEQIPASGAQLKMINMLILNNFALDTLNEQQIQAIRDWTKAGGLLVMAGGAQYKKTAGKLADLSPVEVTGVTSVNALSSMLADKSKPIELNAPFTISQGTITKGKVLYAENGVPLFAVHNTGEGKVLYAAYDLAEEPVASWGGNGRFWADMLIKAFGSSLDTSRLTSLDRLWPLQEAADRIPALKIPEVSWFAVFFGVYALIAGPVLYFILRAKRKQSYMWVIVPGLAIITGIGIFSFGAMQRGTGVMVHQTGFVQLTNDGQARANAVTAFFVPSSGDYKMTIKGSGLSQPILESRRTDQIPKIWASIQADQSEIQFRDVEFWSMRKVASERTIPDAGTIDSNLSYANGALSGTITNKTKYALKEVKVATSVQTQEFPELAPGASVEVNLPFQPSAQMRNNMRQRLATQLLPQRLQQTPREQSREELMLDMVEFWQKRGSNSEVMLAGWTDQPVVESTVQNERVKSESISLITAALQVKPSKDGHVYYPAGTFDVTMSGSSVPVEDEGDGYRLPAGDITFDINLYQDEKKLSIINLYLYTWSDDNTPFAKEVYNWRTKAYEPFEKVFTNNVMTGDKAASFVSADGIIRLKFAHQFGEHRHIGIPNVSVEGKVSNP
ncbi:hypothetical protein BRE01_24810 [Brevibacillus reuszeri]|uniref:DUF7408 domain-containing protein n=1 Tax=Brevibacillus reuszeri TaxID=54915 RepID=A0A0K9YMK4_9BACL|nr:hypothetical protein [Brevibacillus reuszeri]KNB69872.1 hypothetical protein ADS79_28970 [Brevibacillus reuszeri]MED1858226.1 hypothetical protein [Brevibacillus reuszeri]GED68779.1 hypothetical protein BRE01_24810 [Brevibacillus reuszeri]